MLSSLTIILPSMTTFFDALNDYYLFLFILCIAFFFCCPVFTILCYYLCYFSGFTSFFVFVIALDQFCIIIFFSFLFPCVLLLFFCVCVTV